MNRFYQYEYMYGKFRRLSRVVKPPVSGPNPGISLREKDPEEFKRRVAEIESINRQQNKHLPNMRVCSGKSIVLLNGRPVSDYDMTRWTRDTLIMAKLSPCYRSALENFRVLLGKSRKLSNGQLTFLENIISAIEHP